MKKTWQQPQLTIHGSLAQVTQISPKDIVKIGKFIVPSKAFGLFASLMIP